MVFRINSVMIVASAFLLTYFSSCSNEVDSGLNKRIMDSIPIEGKFISKAGELKTSPELVTFSDPYLVLYTPREEFLISVYDVGKKAVVNRFARNGRGPQEFLMLYSMYLSSDKSKLFFWDAGKKELFSLLTSELASANLTLVSEARFQEQFMQQFMLGDDDRYFGSGMFSDARFVLYSNDEKSDIYRTFPQLDVLQDNQERYADTSHLNMACVNVSSLKPEGLLIANIIRTSEILEVFRVDGGKIDRVLAQEWGFEPQRVVHHGEGEFSFQTVNQNSNAKGFEEICTSNDHIFCTYNEIPYGERSSGLKLHGNYLFKIRWDGEIESVFSLNYPIRQFCVTPDGKRLLGVATVDYEPIIMEFLISDL